MKIIFNLRSLLLSLFLFICSAQIFAVNFTVDGISYSTSGSEAYVSGSSGLTFVVIPENITYNGTTYTITKISSAAFRDNTKITAVTIPNSVTSIENYAFRLCSGLTSIEIGNSVISIGEQAFYNCNGLTSIKIPNSVTSIGDAAFYNCTGLTSIEIGNSVISIGDSAFYGCTGLTSIEIPNSVISIGNRTFYGCTGLTSIEIPNSVSSIGNRAFNGCTGLTSATIGNSVRSINDGAFFGCTALKNVIFEDGYGAVSLGVGKTGEGLFYNCPLESLYLGRDLSYNKSPDDGYSPFHNIITLKNVEIGNSVTSIGEYILYGCSGLTNIEIGNSVTAIGMSAFSGCSQLTTISIPAAVTKIDDYTFNGCSGLTSIEIPNSVTSIGETAFAGCTGLTSIEIPHSVISIGNYAFNGCTGLTSIEIPNSVISIGNYAFYGCIGLTSIEIGNSVISIGNYAFNGCTGLTSIEIPHSVISIGNYAFNGCTALKNLTFADGEGTVSLGYNSYASSGTGKGLFYDCPLETLYLGRDITYTDYSSSYPWSSYPQRYGYSAFYGKSDLTDITIGENVTYLPKYLFNNCSALTSIVIPSSVISIGSSAFEGCYRLTSIEIPNSVTSIGNSAFYSCSALKNVTFADGEEPISLGYNSYASSGTGKGLFYDCPLETLYLGRDITYTDYSSSYPWSSYPERYGYSAFYGKSDLTDITIGENVTTLPQYVFYNCSGRDNVKIGSFVKSIGVSAFEGCIGLTSIEIPNSVTSIGSSAFSGCTGLTSIEIGNSVSSIGSYAFNGCSTLKNLTFADGEGSVYLGYNSYASSGTGKGLFYDCPLETLYLGRNITYSDYWNSYPERYGYSAFYGKSDLIDITIGENVTTLNKYIFYKCTGLTSIEIPNSVISIGWSAFEGCSGMTSVTVSSSVTKIEDEVFNGCTALKDVTFEDGEEIVSLGYNVAYGSGGKGLFYDCPLETLYLGRNLSYNTTSNCGYSPFFNIKTLKNVEISKSVTSILPSAFRSCSGLTSIEIPNSVTSIESSAFYGCFGLTSIEIPNSVTSIESSAFYGCTGLTSIEIPNSVTSIESSAFYGCSGLTSIEIPNSVTSIESSAFYGCSGLTSIEIPNSVTSIGNSAFYSCSALKNVTFADGEEPISLGYNSYASSGTGKGLFYDCPLETLYLGRDITYTDYSSSYPWSSYPQRYGYSAFYGKSDLTDITIGENVTYLPKYIFYNYSWLTSIEIPNSVISIGDYAFNGCTALVSIEIPGSVTEVGNSAFGDCSLLEEISFKSGDNNLTLGSGWITGSPVKRLYLDRDISSLSAFAAKSELKDVEFGENISSLPESSFQSCTGLEEITIVGNIRTIGNNCFSGCTALKSLKLLDSDNPLSTGTSWLSGSAVEYLYLGRTISSGSAFAGLAGLKTVEIGRDIQSVPGLCFSGCQSIERVLYTPGSAFAVLPDNAFGDGNYMDTELIINDAQKSIDAAYSPGWLNFRNIYYVDENDERYLPILWNSMLGASNAVYSTENGCVVPRGEALTLKSGATEYALHAGVEITAALLSNDGYTYTPGNYWELNRIYNFNSGEKSRTVALKSPGSLFDELGLQNIQNIEELTISGDLNGTDIMTINRMTALRYLNIEEANIVEGGATYRNEYKTSDNVVGSEFFYNVDNLSTLILPNSVTVINNNAFVDRSSLVNVVIGNSTLQIGNSAFKGCSNLSALVIPRSVESIGNNCFSGCTGLREIILEDAPKALTVGYNGTTGSNAKSLFSDCRLEKVYIGRKFKYPDNWSNAPQNYGYGVFYGHAFLETAEIGQYVTYLDDWYFAGCERLAEVTFPSGMVSFGAYCFSNCKSLNITIPEKLNYLGEYCFNNCISLNNIVLPETLTQLPQYCFNNCISLNNIVLSETLTQLPQYCFNNCSSLSAIRIPPYVSTISDYAFKGCSSLAELTITSNPDDVGNDKPVTRIFEDWTSTNKTNSSISSHTYTFNVDNGDEMSFEAWVDSEVTYDYLSVTLNNKEIVKISGQNQKQTYSQTFTSNQAVTLVVKYTKDNSESKFSDQGGIRNLCINSHGISQLRLGSNGSNPLFDDCILNFVYLGRNLSYNATSSNGYSPFYSQPINSVSISENVTEIGSYLFANCSELSSVQMSSKLTSIGSYAFYNCSSLQSIIVPDQIASLPQYVFSGCSALAKVTLGYELKSINDTSFSGCGSIVELISLVEIPPVITTKVFTDVDKEACQLIVRKGCLVNYWLDPVWQEFLNMSDNLLCLNPLPSARYGDAPVDLSEYAPDGVTLSYETSNPEVVSIDGTMMTIVGAGVATVGASYDADGTPMEIIGQMRQFIVDKADLTLAVDDIIIEVGNEIPAFTLSVDGLVYDETLDDVGELPEFYCEATSDSAPGEYPIYLVGGASDNYNLNLVAGKLTIKDIVVNNAKITAEAEWVGEIQVYDIKGILIYKGPEEDMYLAPGMYIIVRGTNIEKKVIK